MAFLAASSLLGLVGAVTSCCTLPVIGAVVGYAGSMEQPPTRRERFLVGGFFMVGTVAALALLGAATGLISHLSGTSLGTYWRFVTGLLMVLLGLNSLGLLPLRIPRIAFGRQLFDGGRSGALVYGLALGGGTTACAVGCNPLLGLALGAAVLKGTTLVGAAVLTAFAVGYSLPLTAGLVGIGLSLSQLAQVSRWIMPAVKVGAGAVLIAAGFYLLAG